ncbi:MAG: FtsB family cell division protein [Christensenellales bacterium]|jgi:cell division protein DivIC
MDKRFERKERRAKRRSRRKTRRVPAVLVAAVCFVLLSVTIMVNKRLDAKIYERELALKEIQYQLEMQNLQANKLREQLELSKNDSYIANIARTEYGFLADGEIRFVITNPLALWGPEGPPEEFKNK